MSRMPVPVHHLMTTLILASLIVGCGDDAGQITNPWQPPDSLIFAFPFPDQDEVPVSTPVVLRFSKALDDDVAADIENRVQLRHLPDDSVVTVDYKIVSEGRGLVLRPAAAPLVANSSYQLVLTGDGLGSINPAPFDDFRFHTAGLQSGSRDLVGSGPFAMLSVAPLDQASLLVDNPDAAHPGDMDTLRLVFNRTLDPASVTYGETVSLLDNNDMLVEASLYLQGRYLALDPKNDLGSVEHRLVIDGVRSRENETFPSLERRFTPMQTMPRETAILRVGTLGEEQPDMLSRLTGEPLNSVPVRSFIIGNDSSTDLVGDLAADLAFVPDFPDAVPLRVPAGSVLRGSPVDINIIGEVDSGLESGGVLVTLLTDANGYLIPNPLSSADDAPRYALLNMDVAMTAEGTETNAALSQNLLHIQIAGLAIVEDGVLVLDAVGVAEPEVLGLERASGLLSFRMEAYADQRNAPVPVEDTRPLQLQSWVPGDDFQPNARPGDPIILNFNKPLDPASVLLDGAIQVSIDGAPVAPDLAPMRHDGATVIIDGSQIVHNIDIEITLTSLLRDLQGNPLNQDQTLYLRLADFVLPGGSPANLRSPLIASVYPGYPCALVDAVLTGPQEDWRNGRCDGGQSDDPRYPIPELFVEQSLRVIFNRSIDPGSVNESTFFVERRIEDGTWQAIPGHLTILPQRIEFHPDRPWQVGSLYRYTLRSTNNTVNCGVNAICALDGAPIQTRQISQSSSTAPGPRQGGPNLVNHFLVSGEDRRFTVVSLRSLPAADVNANLVLDGAEQGVQDVGGTLVIPPNVLGLRLTSTSGVVTSANLGCSIGEDCPEKRFAYIGSGALQAGVRRYDPEAEVNRRLLDGNPDTDDWTTGAIIADVFPNTLTTSGVFLEARALRLITIPLNTGPLVLRLDYKDNQPIQGFITDTADGPWFSTTFDLLIDAPELEPRLLIELGHDIRSKRVENVTLEGPLRFVDDGRLVLKVRNPDPLVIPANIDLLGIGLAGVVLEVPPLAVDLTFTFLPVKDF